MCYPEKVTNDDSLGGDMQGYNCIIVFCQDESKILFCKRTKDPYCGLYNLVGGKIEAGEDGYGAAYRELEEETGIGPRQLLLHHMMDFTYYNQDCYVEVYAGILNCEVTLQEEAHPLVWLDKEEDFFDMSRFAGEGNIGHMLEQVKQFGMGAADSLRIRRETHKSIINPDSTCIGVDGCKGGWIIAVINHGKLYLDKQKEIAHIIEKYSYFDGFLIDMVIGLQSDKTHIRPDAYARRIIRERSSTIFPAPCRQAVYAGTVERKYNENVRILGKKFTPLTLGIIPKIQEVDSFLQNNPQYKNVIKESHPEVCFAQLNGKTVLSQKNQCDGVAERILILQNFLPEINLSIITETSIKYKCNIDDIIDAICLAVTANLMEQGKFKVIPEEPMKDEEGLLMQMIIPEYKE